MTFMPRLARAAGLALLVTALTFHAASAAEKVTVFAAASLKDVLTSISETWKSETGNEVVLSFAGSSALAKQIAEGAPADLFISADLDWMDTIEKQGLVKEGTRLSLLGNRIVLVAPADSKAELKVAPGFDLAGVLGDGKLAMANTDSVPAGKYGKAALTYLKAWDVVAAKVIRAENVRAALSIVARGEAKYGIVYATDAAAEPRVKRLHEFPAASYPEIRYPVAATTTAVPTATRFLTYLTSPAAQKIFVQRGFTALAKP